MTPALADAPGPPVRIVVGIRGDVLLALLPRLYTPPARTPGIDPTARIGRGVELPGGCDGRAYASSGPGRNWGHARGSARTQSSAPGVVLGDDVRICPSVTLTAARCWAIG